jgi:predicted nucleic acid-binding protein
VQVSVRSNARPGGLIDTSALVAIVDAGDPWHERCRAAYASSKLPLIATDAVLTEAFHFALRRGKSLRQPTWNFIRLGAIQLAPIMHADLPVLEQLMHRYADRPMDFADATLVHVAQREGLNTILTVDHDDFETYRIGRNAKFRILPARAR